MSLYTFDNDKLKMLQVLKDHIADTTNSVSYTHLYVSIFIPLTARGYKNGCAGKYDEIFCAF